MRCIALNPLGAVKVESCFVPLIARVIVPLRESSGGTSGGTTSLDLDPGCYLMPIQGVRPHPLRCGTRDCLTHQGLPSFTHKVSLYGWIRIWVYAHLTCPLISSPVAVRGCNDYSVGKTAICVIVPRRVFPNVFPEHVQRSARISKNWQRSGMTDRC